MATSEAGDTASEAHGAVTETGSVGAYWDAWYSAGAAPVTPSQFAVFVLDEVASGCSLLIDVGCGSGRDSFFFAQQGIPTLAIDASAVAIERCRSRVFPEPPPVEFLNLVIGDPALSEAVRQHASVARRSDDPIVIYARFFLHAISADAETAFLDWAAQLLRELGGVLAIEFRTTRDVAQPKRTGRHYRRYVDPIEAIAAAQDRGLRLAYFVEGFGFARYQGEDAHVARCLFRP